MMTRLMPLAAAPLALLMACSGGGDADADGDGVISTGEAAQEAGRVTMQPGEWETRVQLTEFEMDGMPAGAREAMQRQMGQPETSASCITPEQASNPEGDMFAAGEHEDCTYNEFDMSGGRMLIDAVCQPEGMGGSMTMHMEGRYTPTSYALDMDMAIEGEEGAPMRMSGTVEGNRVGECDDAAGGGAENAER